MVTDLQIVGDYAPSPRHVTGNLVTLKGRRYWVSTVQNDPTNIYRAMTEEDPRAFSGFETVVLLMDENWKIERRTEAFRYTLRYSTREEAQAGHQEVLRRLHSGEVDPDQKPRVEYVGGPPMPADAGS